MCDIDLLHWPVARHLQELPEGADDANSSTQSCDVNGEILLQRQGNKVVNHLSLMAL
jgi:hypothetical protein